MLSSGFLSHLWKLQGTVALLFNKAEYMATTEAEKKTLWISQFLTFCEFWFLNQSINLRADNKGTISLTENSEFHRKTKHIEVR